MPGWRRLSSGACIAMNVVLQSAHEGHERGRADSQDRMNFTWQGRRQWAQGFGLPGERHGGGGRSGARCLGNFDDLGAAAALLRLIEVVPPYPVTTCIWWSQRHPVSSDETGPINTTNEPRLALA